MGIPGLQIDVPARIAAQVGLFVPAAMPDLGVNGLVAEHRWHASRIDPRAGSVIQSLPDTMGASSDHQLILADPGDGSPRPAVVDVLGWQGLRVNGWNVQSTAKYYAATPDRSFWAAFRLANGNGVRLGALGWGRDTNFSRSRVTLGGGAYLTGDNTTKTASVLVIAACLTAAGLAGATNGLAMVASGSYTPPAPPPADPPTPPVSFCAQTMSTKAGAACDVIEMGTVARALSQADLISLTASLSKAYGGAS